MTNFRGGRKEAEKEKEKEKKLLFGLDGVRRSDVVAGDVAALSCGQ